MDNYNLITGYDQLTTNYSNMGHMGNHLWVICRHASESTIGLIQGWYTERVFHSQMITSHASIWVDTERNTLYTIVRNNQSKGVDTPTITVIWIDSYGLSGGWPWSILVDNTMLSQVPSGAYSLCVCVSQIWQPQKPSKGQMKNTGHGFLGQFIIQWICSSVFETFSSTSFSRSRLKASGSLNSMGSKLKMKFLPAPRKP